ncbi:hypothetical protein HanPI659440_Chr08g0285501 [Helianthus annuus]|nr:hypothetical protein HanPI659440_Chr08g0285501 [Helianthus annuus]
MAFISSRVLVVLGSDCRKTDSFLSFQRLHIDTKITAWSTFFFFVDAPEQASCKESKSYKSKAIIGGILHHSAMFCQITWAN